MGNSTVLFYDWIYPWSGSSNHQIISVITSRRALLFRLWRPAPAPIQQMLSGCQVSIVNDFQWNCTGNRGNVFPWKVIWIGLSIVMLNIFRGRKPTPYHRKSKTKIRIYAFFALFSVERTIMLLERGCLKE